MAQRPVPHDHHHPLHELSRLTTIFQPVDRFHKRVLHHILGVLSIPKYSERNGKRRAVVSPHQNIEGVGVAAQTERDEIGVGRRGRHGHYRDG